MSKIREKLELLAVEYDSLEAERDALAKEVHFLRADACARGLTPEDDVVPDDRRVIVNDTQSTGSLIQRPMVVGDQSSPQFEPVVTDTDDPQEADFEPTTSQISSTPVAKRPEGLRKDNSLQPSWTFSLVAIGMDGFKNVLLEHDVVWWESALVLLGDTSCLAWWALFLGGFGVMRTKSLQRTYDTIFVASFVICFLSCLINLFLQTPPFYDFLAHFATVYFHIYGFHAWLFWRGFVRDKQFQELVYSFRQNAETTSDFKFVVSVVAVLFTVIQVIGIILGYLAFPQPAAEFWIANNSSMGTRYYALAHSVVMWIAIPQHVPTVVATAGLYYFTCHLHVLDARRLSMRLSSKVRKTEKSFPEILEASCELVEIVQDRLFHTCRQCTILWIHQLLFASMQLVLVFVDIRHNGEFIELDRRQWWKLAHLAYHALFGILLFSTALVVPAYITHTFLRLPRHVLKILRSLGVPYEKLAMFYDFLATECVGYRVGATPVTQAMVFQFAYGICLLSSFYLLTGRSTLDE